MPLDQMNIITIMKLDILELYFEGFFPEFNCLSLTVLAHDAIEYSMSPLT